MIRLVLRGARLAVVDTAVLLFLGLFGSHGRPSLNEWIRPFPDRAGAAEIERLPYGRIITQAANEHGIDPALLAAVVKQESRFNPDAVSKSGAVGLGQLMPGTAADMGVIDPFDPAQNLDGAAAYLAMLLTRYDGDIRLALAGYNAGPGTVDGCRCVPENGETPGYVANVTAYYAEFRRGQDPATGQLYAAPVQITNGRLHGLAGWEGVDIQAGCGQPIYNPLGAAVVTFSGLDGYSSGPYSNGRQNTMLTLESGALELTLLHGLYMHQVGNTVQAGELIGYEDRIGNATGCHSHVILRMNGRVVNFLDMQ